MGYMPEVHVRQYLHSGERLSLGKNKVNGEVARQRCARLLPAPQQEGCALHRISPQRRARLRYEAQQPARPGCDLRLKGIASSPAACVSEALKFFGKAKS